MPLFGPVKRKEPVRYLDRLGSGGPYSGGKHQLMGRGDVAVRIPNPQHARIGREPPGKILHQAGIGRGDWEKL